MSRADLELFLERTSVADQRALFQLAGLRLNPSRAGGRAALLRSRFPSLPPDVVHQIAAFIGSKIALGFIEADSDTEEVVDVVAPLLPQMCVDWSPGLVRVMLASFAAVGGLTEEQRAELVARLEAEATDGHATPAAGGGGPDPAGGDHADVAGGDDADPAGVGHADVAGGDGADPAGGRGADLGRSTVPAAGCAMDPAGPRPVTRTRLDPASTPARALALADGGPLHHLVLDQVLAAGSAPPSAALHHPDTAVATAVDHLVNLAPSDPASWLLAGAAEVLVPRPGGREPPGIEVLADHLLAGRLAALVACGDQDRLIEAAASAGPDTLGRLVSSEPGAVLAAPTVAALVADHQALAIEMLRTLDERCEGWQDLLDAVNMQAAALFDDKQETAAESLLRAADEALTVWAVAATDDRETATALHRAAAELALGRARCRRSRRDVNNALHLLDQVPADLLDPADRSVRHAEAALCRAGLPGLDALPVPGTEAERAQLLRRLDPARADLTASLDHDPTNLDALTLRGMLAACEDDDARAAADLATVCSRADGALAPEHAAALQVLAAVCQLRLLEPGTEEACRAAITGVLDAGHQPSPGLLTAAAVALDVHGSPAAADLVAEAIRRGDDSADTLELLGGLARRGFRAALDTAQKTGTDHRRRLDDRFRLLADALTGTGEVGDVARAEVLLGEIEDVLWRACEDRLDEAWATTLATDDHLRQLLEPAHADSARIHVLRRLGHLEEAAALARALLRRAAAGSLPGFDARELAALCTELGDEHAAFEARVLTQPAEPEPDDDRPRPGRPVEVLFVGGDEAYARHDRAVEDAVTERHGDQVRLTWIHPGWGSVWSPVADRVEARYETTDALVLCSHVRTMFGRRLRRTAGQAGVPWVACTGQGRGTIHRAVERAIDVAIDRALR